MEWKKERIRAYRKKLGLTQEQFASLLGTSQEIISGWETGRQNPCGMSQKFLTLLASKDIKKDIEKIKSKEQKESSLSGDTIRAFREKISLSQSEFASRLGRDDSTVSYWESKKMNPSKKSLQALKKLAEKSSISLEELNEPKGKENKGSTDNCNAKEASSEGFSVQSTHM